MSRLCAFGAILQTRPTWMPLLMRPEDRRTSCPNLPQPFDARGTLPHIAVARHAEKMLDMLNGPDMAFTQDMRIHYYSGCDDHLRLFHFHDIREVMNDIDHTITFQLSYRSFNIVQQQPLQRILPANNFDSSHSSLPFLICRHPLSASIQKCKPCATFPCRNAFTSFLRPQYSPKRHSSPPRCPVPNPCGVIHKIES